MVRFPFYILFKNYDSSNLKRVTQLFTGSKNVPIIFTKFKYDLNSMQSFAAWLFRSNFRYFLLQNVLSVIFLFFWQFQLTTVANKSHSRQNTRLRLTKLYYHSFFNRFFQWKSSSQIQRQQSFNLGESYPCTAKKSYKINLMPLY